MHAEEPNRFEFAADFRVGDWLVEPSLDRLSRNGTVLRLRPQLIDLLVLLARHAGRTVSKDAILETVWEGQHVAESGMTRCIAELRQALEDDAHEPKVIQTIPKRGYRLVAPVEFPTPAEASTAAGDGAPSPQHAEAAVAAPEPESLLESVTESAAASPAESAAARTASRRPPRRIGWALGWSVAAVLVAAFGWVAFGWSRAPILVERDTVLLADFTNTTGDSAFDGTLRLAAALHLGQAPFLRMLSTDRMRAALTRMGRSPDQPVVGPVALEVCRREGAAVLLAGSIAKLGTNYAVGIEAIACRTGEPVGRELREVEGKDRVLTALGAAAARLRQTLGESRASLLKYDVPIVQATTPSLEALKALSLGDLSRDNGRLADALTFYRRATDLDPQFALAWARRGAAARHFGLSVNDQRFGEPDEPTLSFRKAYELRHRVSEPERFYILGHYYRLVANDPGKAVETYKMWKRIYPGSPVPPTNLASLYINTYGQYEPGLSEAREAVRLAPQSSVALSKLVAAHMGSNQIPEAKQVLRDAASRGVADLLMRSLAIQISLAEGDEKATAEHARWASSDPLAKTVMTQYRALAAASAGRIRESRQLWEEATRTAAPIWSPVRQSDVRVTEAETEALLGDPRAARAAAEAALASDQRPGTLLAVAGVFALSGDRARAGRLVDQVTAGADRGMSAPLVWHPLGRAQVEAGLGRFDRALEIVRDAAPFERGRDYNLAPLGVRASIELSAGRPAEAAATFREILRLRMTVPTSPWVAFARIGVARALRQTGDVEGSSAAYTAVLQAMTSADPDAPLLVAARRELAALRGR